jgi:hypothetical protein
MASVSLPFANDDENELTTESTKIKRLPRSAKKRLRYERIRQKRKEFPKKKKHIAAPNRPSSVEIPSSSSESNSFFFFKN